MKLRRVSRGWPASGRGDSGRRASVAEDVAGGFEAIIRTFFG